jgi:hypothetical protein
VLWGCPVIVAQNTTVSDMYWGIGDSIGRYSGILIPGIGGIDRKTASRIAYVSYAQVYYLLTPLTLIIDRVTSYRLLKYIRLAATIPRPII